MMPVDRVLAFCKAWCGPDLDAVLAMLSEDILFENGPLPVLRGKPAVAAYLTGITGLEASHWEVVRIAACGNHILTERVDTLVVAGRNITLPIMGSFEVERDLIGHWRDYFDLTSYRAQWPNDTRTEMHA